MKISRWLAVVSVPALAVALGGSPVAAGAVSAPAPAAVAAAGRPGVDLSPTVRIMSKAGTAHYRSTPVGTARYASLATELTGHADPDSGFAPAAAHRRTAVNRSLAAERKARGTGGAVVAGAALAKPFALSIVPDGPVLQKSFDGLDHRDQRTADNGNQFSTEPPDQGLCVGGGHVVEAVNDAFRVFKTDGSPQTGVESMDTFFGYPSEIDRKTGAQGPFVTDPSCLYDPTTQSFFLVVLTLEIDPATGAETGDNHLDLAVAKDPTKTWTIYSLDVTDDGSNGTPVHPDCPCLGDYPHIGVDATGLYLTTNEYPDATDGFNGAQVYAFSKRALADGASRVLVSQFDTAGADRGRNGFTLWPAQSPSTGQYSTAGNGTEYLLSSNAAPEATGSDGPVTSSSIVTWSLSNTRSLTATRPSVRLHSTRVPVHAYTLPPQSNQKAGPVPLADCLTFDPCGSLLLGGPDPVKPEVESPLDSNDTRMQQVTYTGGRLYGALDTAVSVGGSQRAGIAWYIVKPSSTTGGVTAGLSAEGQLGLSGNNLIYPAVGLTSAGRGVMTFTLVGNGYYPSAAYSAFDGRTGAGSIFVAKAGLGPQDGFSGYAAFNLPDPPRPRWGDYGATAVDGSSLWIASEYIGQTCTDTQYFADPLGTCNGTRTALANWDTRISKVTP